MLKPALLIKDENIIKQILVKDFAFATDHDIQVSLFSIAI
jgi:hypothetical protein